MLPDTDSPAPLQAALSSFVLDFVARQKFSGTHLKYFTAYQLPVPNPSSFKENPGWDRGIDIDAWISVRVLELVYVDYRMFGYAAQYRDAGLPFRWSETRRELIRAELDAAFFHIYGLERVDVEYVMESFPIIKRKQVAANGEYKTERLILEAYDAMANAIETGVPYKTPLCPPPGEGARHPARVFSPKN